jgi:hypothetical protein
MLYSFGLALSVPSMSMTTLGIFPSMRGLAASLQNFTQMLIFALVAGFVAPALFGSAFKLAAGVAVGLILAAVLWASAATIADDDGCNRRKCLGKQTDLPVSSTSMKKLIVIAALVVVG